MSADRRHENMTGRIVPRHENDDNEKFQTGASIRGNSSSSTATGHPQSYKTLEAFVNARITEALRDSKRRINNLEEQNTRSMDLSDQIHAMEGKLQNNELEMKVLRKENKDLRDIVTDARSTIKRPLNEMNDLKKEVEEIVQTAENRVAEMLTIRKKVYEDIAAVSAGLADLSKVREQGEQHTARLQAIDARIDGLAKSVQNLPTLEEQSAQSHTRIESLATSVRAISCTIQDLDARFIGLSTLQDEMTQNSAETEDWLRDKINFVAKNLDNLDHTVSSSKAPSATELSKKLEEQKQTAEQMQCQVDELSAKLVETESKVSGPDSSIGLEQTVQSLNQRVEKAEQSITVNKKDCEDDNQWCAGEVERIDHYVNSNCADIKELQSRIPRPRVIPRGAPRPRTQFQPPQYQQSTHQDSGHQQPAFDPQQPPSFENSSGS